MGAAIEKLPQWTAQGALQTRDLARREVRRRKALEEAGYFGEETRTGDIEHETQILNARTGEPWDAEAHFIGTDLNTFQTPEGATFRARLDTSRFMVEHDGGNGITALTEEGILGLFGTFRDTTRGLQERISAIDANAIVVPIGTNPTLTPEERGDWTETPENRRNRFRRMEEITERENKVRGEETPIVIFNARTGEQHVDKRFNSAAYQIVSGTQFHMSERNIPDAMLALQIARAITGPMVALFGNSPYVAGIDSGLGSSRMSLLQQSEPKRLMLPPVIHTLEEYYQYMLRAAVPAFMASPNGIGPEETERQALDLTMGTMYPTARLIADPNTGVVRLEYRMIDAQSPLKAAQAFALTKGLREGLAVEALPTAEEAEHNFRASPRGFAAPMRWGGKATNAKELGLHLIKRAHGALVEIGMPQVAEYLELLAAEVREGRSQAEMIRGHVQSLELQGMDRRSAIASAMRELSRQALA